MYEVYHVEERQAMRKGIKSPKVSAARCVFFGWCSRVSWTARSFGRQGFERLGGFGVRD